MRSDAEITVERVESFDDDFEKVFRLYRRYSGTLGFMPHGGFEDYASAGSLLGAYSKGRLVGYTMFRRGSEKALLVHLCVEESYRGRGVGDRLLCEVIRETSDLTEVRLACRQEYAANKLWARHGFRHVADRQGRGKDGGVLHVWRRTNTDDAPLLTLAAEHEQGDRSIVVVDANVFIDFDSEDATSDESKSLLADWLVPEIQICVTAEHSNEVGRIPDPVQRKRRRRQMLDYRVLEAVGKRFDETHPLVNSLLPAAKSERDRSDRRQLAQAVACQADYFVTRDGALLGQASVLDSRLGIRVVRPVDLVGQIHSAKEPEAYAPARLVGTNISQRSPESESECLRFQRFAEAERKSEFLQRCREVMSQPGRYDTVLVTPPGSDPVVLFAVEHCDDRQESRIALARTLTHQLAPTIVRTLLAKLTSSLRDDGINTVWCDDCADPTVVVAARELGFRMHGTRMVKMTGSGLLSSTCLPARLGPVPQFPWSEEQYRSVEEQLWPLKISDSPVRTFMVPIKPHWAAQLFDEELAERELFATEAGLALALENVYYSTSRINIPAGSRILWYVSKNKDEVVRQVRACSRSLGTDKGTAREMFRKFRRLGVYCWKDILRRTEGEPHGHIAAYRFAFTELARKPIPWNRLQEILRATQGANPIASPVDVTAAFDVLYREAFVDC